MLDVQSIPAALREVRDAQLARIEDAGLTASQPREQAVFDGWLLRYANGKAKRARSVNVVGAGRLPLDEKLAWCEAFYRRHGVPFIVRLTPFSQPATLDAALAERGFVAAEDSRVMVTALVPGSAARAPASELPELDRSEFGAVLAALHGLDPARAAVERDRFAYSVLDGVYLAVREGGRCVACGSAVVDGDLVGIFGMVTAPSHRRRGLATRLLDALLRRARERGCTTAYLQVDATNAPARHAYSNFGFKDRYAYWYRSAPSKEKR